MGDSGVHMDTPPSPPSQAINTSDPWIPRIELACHSSSVVSAIDLYIPQNGHVYQPVHTTQISPPSALNRHYTCQPMVKYIDKFIQRISWLGFNSMKELAQI